MSTGRNERRRLDALLSRLEDEILRLDDSAILSEDEDSLVSIEHVRALIRSRIDACASINHSQPYTGMGGMSSRHRRRRSEAVPIAVPEEAAERRRLLKTLVAKRIDLPKQVRIAFSASEEPLESEVDASVAQLVRLGILKDADKGD